MSLKIRTPSSFIGLEPLPNSPKHIKPLNFPLGLDIEWDGPICDSEGFYQHSGECLSDSFQMLFINADGIKESVQEQLINDPIQLKKVRDRVKSASSPTEHKYLVEYLQALRSRFLRHYAAEKKRRIVFKESGCKDQSKMIDLLQAIGKEPHHRADAANIYKSAIYQRAIVNYDHPISDPEETLSILRRFGGKTFITIQQLFRMYELLSLYFQLGEIVEFIRETTTLYNPLLTTTAIQVTNVNRKTHNGHSTLFYTCGGIEYYYDDNTGIIPFPWRRYMDIKSYPPLESGWERYHSIVGLDIHLDNNNEDEIFKHHPFYPCLIDKHGDTIKIYIIEPTTERLIVIQGSVHTEFIRHIESAPIKKYFLFSRKADYDKKYRIHNRNYILKDVIYANLLTSTNIPYNGEPIIPGSRLPRTRPILGGKRNRRTRKKKRVVPV